jgi:hypothetical protein
VKLLLNYADAKFVELQKVNSATGLSVGGFDRVLSCGPTDIDAEFASKNQHLLEQPRGGGYWLWKPYFICRALASLSADDYLFYCDAGARFLASIDPLIELSRRDGQDVIPFELPYIEKCWTKRDAFVALGCDSAEFTETRQRLASFHLWRASDFSVQLAQEWLERAQEARLITDMPNESGLPDYAGFREHRHDQSLFSLLTKLRALAAYRNPAQHGNVSYMQKTNSPYGQLILHTRHPPSFLGRLRRLRRNVRRTTESWLRSAARSRDDRSR